MPKGDRPGIITIHTASGDVKAKMTKLWSMGGRPKGKRELEIKMMKAAKVYVNMHEAHVKSSKKFLRDAEIYAYTIDEYRSHCQKERKERKERKDA